MSSDTENCRQNAETAVMAGMQSQKCVHTDDSAYMHRFVG